jgi:hypothetical protein
VFHTSLLTPYRETTTHGPNFSRPPPDMIEGQEEYEVESIVAHRQFGRGKKLHYLIKWKGYPASDNTWEPEENVHAPDLILRYRQQSSQQNNRQQSNQKGSRQRSSQRNSSSIKRTRQLQENAQHPHLPPHWRTATSISYTAPSAPTNSSNPLTSPSYSAQHPTRATNFTSSSRNNASTPPSPILSSIGTSAKNDSADTTTNSEQCPTIQVDMSVESPPSTRVNSPAPPISLTMTGNILAARTDLDTVVLRDHRRRTPRVKGVTALYKACARSRSSPTVTKAGMVPSAVPNNRSMVITRR